MWRRGQTVRRARFGCAGADGESTLFTEREEFEQHRIGLRLSGSPEGCRHACSVGPCHRLPGWRPVVACPALRPQNVSIFRVESNRRRDGSGRLPMTRHCKIQNAEPLGRTECEPVSGRTIENDGNVLYSHRLAE